MKRFFPMHLLFALVALGISTSASRAQPGPLDVVDHFRLVPHRTGGIAGVDERYRLSGEYDFRQRLDEHKEAKFEHAEIWGSQISDLPVPAVVIDVDEILNLEGLKGERLPVLAPFNVYKFTGEASSGSSSGSSVNLFAAVLGNWMYVRGGTEPPPDSADFFTHRVQWLARSRPFADVSGNGVVDAADFVMIRKAETSGAAIGSEVDGTAGVTFADWRQQFGETIPDVMAIDAVLTSAMASVAAGTVPEPASLGLVIVGCIVLSCVRRRAG